MATPFSQSIQSPLRLVTVLSITSDGQTALCADKQGNQVSVPLFYQKAKGILPLTGEQWYVSNASGVWLFDTFVGTSTSQFPTTGGSSSGGGTPSAFAQAVYSYAGTPGAGNPPAAYVSTAGKDPYGAVLPYVASFGKPAAFAVDGNGNALVLNSTQQVQAALAPEQGTYSAGLNLIEIPVLVYSGQPRSGNLIISLSGQSGTDKYGNQYSQGFNAVAGAIPAGLLTGTVPGSVQPIGGTSLNFNPYLAGGDLTGWQATGAAMHATQVPQGPYPWSIQLISTGTGPAYVSQPAYPVKVAPNTQYQVVGWEYINATGVQAELGITWLATTDPASAISTSTQNLTITPSTWDPVSAVFTSPTGANYAFPIAGTAGSTGPGMLSYVQAILLLPQVPGGLIQAGTITAAQIAANTITAAQIAAGTITATEIAAHTITAAQIAAGTITATEIAAGTIIAGAVDGTTITGASLVSTGTQGDYLMYNGSVAIGNLTAAFSAQAFTDSVGDVIPAGFNWGDWDAVGVLRNHFGIDLNGNTYLADTSGTTRIFVGNNPPRMICYNAAHQIVTYIDPINSGVFQYQDLDTVSPTLAHSTQGSTNTSGPLTVTIPATTAGNALIVAINADGTSANPVVNTVTLGGSGTGWSKITNVGNALYSDCEIWANFNIAAAQTSVVISLTGGIGSIQITADVYEWSGLANPATDTLPVGNSTTTGASSWNSGTTVSLSSVTDIAIGIVATAAATTITGPATGGWTNLAQQTGANTAVKSGYTTTPVPAGVAYAGTFSASSPYTAVVATFKAKAVTQGSLVFAQCAKSTTDPVTSVALQAGVSTFSARSTGINFPTSASEEAAMAAITSEIFNPGASEQLLLAVLAPAVSGAGNGAHPYIALNSTAKDGSVQAAGKLLYVDSASAIQTLLQWGNNKGLIQGFQSGRNGGIPASQRDIFTRTATVIGLTAITTGYTAPGNEVVAGMEGFTYRIKAAGTGTWSSNTSGALQMQAFGSSRTIMSFVFSTAFLTSGHNFQWTAELDLIVATVGSTGGARITGTMWIVDTAGGPSFTAVCNALIGGFTVDTTASNTIGLNWSWAGTAGGSISCYTSELTRIPSTAAV